jgi:hypothetical protein
LKFLLFVEGETEQKVLPNFFRRWLEPKLDKRPGFKTVQFHGWPEYDRDIKKKVALHLSGPGEADIIAAIGIIDLYGPSIFPPSTVTSDERFQWGKKYFEDKVNNPKFRHYFAVHETEAWLLAEPEKISVPISTILPNPEKINFQEPPARVLEKAYYSAEKRAYKKFVDGYNLFERLSPEVAYSKCPYLRQMLDEMLLIAKGSGH